MKRRRAPRRAAFFAVAGDPWANPHMRPPGWLACAGVVLSLSSGCAAAFHERGASMAEPSPPPDVLSGAVGPDEGDQEVQTEAQAAVLAAPAVRRVAGQARRPPRLLVEAGQARLAPTNRGTAADLTAPAQLVVTGSIELSADDVRATAAAVRAGALARGGVLVADEVTGARYGVRARFQIRLPPDQVASFVDWLGSQGTLESSNLSASDVSQQYVDQELRLHTLHVELDRLEKLMTEHPDAALNDVLAIEREMTRVRSEIEQLEGKHRYLADRVARSTLDVHITARESVVAGAPEQKFTLVGHGLSWSFVDGGDRHRQRFGAGVQMLLARRFDFTFDVLPARGADARSMLLTMGGALFSDFLGRGRRLYGNPYLGLRAGGGGVNGRGAFVYAGELGVELVHHPHFLLDVTGRAMGLLYGGSPRSDIVLQGLLGVGIPF